MAYDVFYHPSAEEELDRLYENIASAAGYRVAGRYVDGLIRFIEALSAFPERGSVRPGVVPGLRIIGYRRTISIAFSVHEHTVLILGVFARGRDITSEMLEERSRR
jgi:toxin ParE1/3/4